MSSYLSHSAISACWHFPCTAACYTHLLLLFPLAYRLYRHFKSLILSQVEVLPMLALHFFFRYKIKIQNQIKGCLLLVAKSPHIVEQLW